MIEKLHDQMILELKLNERSNTIFVLSGIVLNLIILAINSALSGNDDPDIYFIMILFSILMIAYSIVAIMGINRGRQIRTMLIDGLMKMYEDSHVDQYYDRALLADYRQRYRLLVITIYITGAVSLVVPFVASWLI